MAKANWIRTGGAIGDNSMAEMEAFNDAGAGVIETLKEAGDDGSAPNEGVYLEQKPGAES